MPPFPAATGLKTAALSALGHRPASAYGAPMPLGVAALAVDLHLGSTPGRVPTDVRLIPAGEFRSWDGRPADLTAWVMSDADGARLVAQMAERQSACVIDYEHATVHAKASGAKAPAAGWYTQLEWRPGDGLYAIGIDWTAQAARHIAAGEYRYVSPVFTFDETTGHVERLLYAALTNDPGLDGLTDLAALAAQLLLPPSPPKEPTLPEILKKLLLALGLQETATEAEALAALATLKTNVAALSAQPDPAKYVPVATLNALQSEHVTLRGQLATLQAEVAGGKLEKLLADGKAAGKITPATESWARNLGAKDIAELSAWLGVTPVVVKPGDTQTGGKKPGGPAGGVDVTSGPELARAALSYQAAQAAAGISVTTLQAVAHVIKPNGA